MLDELDGSLIDGDISLRDAIAAATAAETIDFDTSLNGGTILLTLGELSITKAMTVDATSLGNGLTIDATGNDPTPSEDNGDGSRVFDIDDGDDGNNIDVAIKGLILTGGDSMGDGGAIRSAENLTVVDSIITGNVIGRGVSGSDGGDGGGIWARGALTLIRSTVSGNSAGDGGQGGQYGEGGDGGDGGGIWAADTLTVSQSTISGNSAGDGRDGYHGDGGSGGGIQATGQVTITGSTITGNSAGDGGDGGVGGDGGDGGGIWTADSLTVSESTIFGNSAGDGGDDIQYYGGGGGDGGSGGGIWTSNTLTITESTIRGNSAGDGGSSENGGKGGSGGGIWTSGTLTIIETSMISENSAGNGISGDGSRGGDGGGILTTGTTTITNCAIFWNAAGAGGNGQYHDDGGGGGGIHATGPLTITGSTITGNSAGDGGDSPLGDGGYGGSGGGIQATGPLTITGSTITGNSAGNGGDADSPWYAFWWYVGGTGGAGGGIQATGQVTITGSTISGNSAGDGGDGPFGGYGGSGGGIWTSNTLTITESTISGNSGGGGGYGYYGVGSGGGGGGIFSDTSLDSTQARITNSTISGNITTGTGGGVFNADGLTIIEHSTITENEASADQGSGVASEANTSTRTEVYCSIIAGNVNSDVDFIDGVINSFQSNGYNLIGSGNADPAFAPAVGDIIGVNPLLEPLANNGGPTLTQRLLPGSPAIDAGDPEFLSPPEYDQRGEPFRRVSNGCLDIGAFEVWTRSLFSTGIPINTNADGAAWVTGGDLDGDGDQDVLSASYHDDTITWYENLDGMGTFGPAQVISTAADGANSVFAADLDNDGDMDVLSASSSDDEVAWYENLDGNGSFGPQQIITTNADGAFSVYAADLDGDGDLDVLSGSFGDDKVAWYENLDGAGTFGAQQVIATADSNSVFAADIDKDGDLDVLSTSASGGKILWYENTDGVGSFSAEQVITTGVTHPASVLAADIDLDGDMDVLAALRDDNRISWYENTDGQGTFGQEQLVSSQTMRPIHAYAADVDGDGDIDVLSASLDDDKIAWYSNEDGQGTFGSQLVISTDADFARSVFAADVDHDGDTDVLSASQNDDTIAWYRNETIHRSAAFSATLPISTGADGAISVFSADLDKDGDLDVLSASFSDDTIAWYENTDGAGTFGAPHVISWLADGAEAVYAADLDKDGDVDVLSASSLDNKIAWYENQGNGTFGSQQVISTGANSPVSVVVADIDGDGDQDVLSASSNDDKIVWYENTDGAGAFGPQRVITTAADFAASVSVADVDRDGDIDVLSASTQDDKIAWYENMDGTGTFGPQQVITTTAQGARAVFTADVDGDGDQDVLSASAHDDKIAWYENTDGTGSFGDQQPISISANFADAVMIADLDGDGDVDVLSASEFDDKIAWYENTDGIGTFGTQQIITTTADNARSVFAADIDGDGDQDVLSASSEDNTVAWYRNQGGQFSMDTLDTAPPSIPEGESDDALSITVSHLGWASDHSEELASLSILFEGMAPLVPSNPVLNLTPGASVTLYLWSTDDQDYDTSIGMNVVSDTSGIISFTGADLYNPELLSAAFQPPLPSGWFRWSAAAVNGGEPVDPDIVEMMNAVNVTITPTGSEGITSNNDGTQGLFKLLDPLYDQEAGAFLLGSVSFDVLTSGETTLTINQDLTAMFVNVGEQIFPNFGSVGIKGSVSDLLDPSTSVFFSTVGDVGGKGLRALSSDEANALIETLYIYRDDGNGVFDPSDTSVATVDSLSLADGLLTVPLPDGDPAVEITHGSPVTFFVVPELTIDAAHQSVAQFQMTHVTDGPNQSTAHDRDANAPLLMQCSSNVPSSLITALSVAPTVESMVRMGTDPTNAEAVAFTVEFSADVTGVDTTDFVVTASGSVTGTVATVVPVSGSVYTVTVNAISGEGTLRLDLIDDDSIRDSGLDPLGGSGLGNGDFVGEAYTIDRVFPVVQSMVRADASPTSFESVDFVVEFSEDVSGVSLADFVLTTGGSANGVIHTVTPSSESTYLVTVNGITGTGILQLNLLDDDSIVDSLANRLGGTGAGNGDFAGEAYDVDRQPPVVLSIVRQDSDPTNLESVDFLVTLSEAVTGVDVGDFVLNFTGSAAGTIGSVTPINEVDYVVTVDNVAGLGTLQLVLTDDDSIVDTVTNRLGGVGAGNGDFAGETYTVDRVVPVVQSIVRTGPNPATSDEVGFTVTFSEAVTGVDDGDFTLSLSGSASGTISDVLPVGYAVYEVTVTTVNGVGTLQLNLLDNDSIADGLTNTLGGPESGNGDFSGETYDVFVPILLYTSPLGNGADDLTLRRNGDSLEIFDTLDATVVASLPVADTHSVAITGANGEVDHLTVDFLYGGFFPVPNGISFEGGTGGDDSLSVIGDADSSAIYAPSGISANEGLVTVNRDAETTEITFTGLEPLEVSSMLTLTLLSPNSTDHLTIQDTTASGGQRAAIISGSSGGVSFESMSFYDVVELHVDTGTNDEAGSDSDTIVFLSDLSAMSTAQLVIAMGTGADTLDTGTVDIAFAGAIVLEGTAASLVLAGNTIQVTSLHVPDGRVSGYGIILGDSLQANTLAPSGGSVNLAGSFNFGTRDGIVLSSGFSSLGSFVSMDGGTVRVPNGLLIPGASTLQGNGAVVGRISAALGSTIIATDNLSLGDLNAFDGFLSEGSLYVDNHAVTLNDRNESLLGFLTHLGNASGPGALHAPNGTVLRDGRTLLGHGTVSAEFENQGDVIGDGPLPDDSILFTGPVVGLGDFDGNITFAERYAPGEGAGFIAFGGNAAWEPEANLEIRIRGLQAGVGYSRLNIDGNASLAGTFQVLLDVAPAVGNNFTIMTFGSSEGDFTELIGLDLGNGLRLVPYLTEHSFSLYTESFIKGDVNRDGYVNGLDVDPFVDAVILNSYSHNADVNNDGLVNGLDVAPFVAAVISGGTSAGVAQFSAVQHVAPAATVEPEGTAAPVLTPPAAERPLRSRHVHNSNHADHDSRFAPGRMVDEVFTRRLPIRTRVGHDGRRVRRKDVFRPVQPEAADDWHAAVDDALRGDTDWIA